MSKRKKLCEFEGCMEHGEYRAPKSRVRLNDYYYFCLEHVREYNKAWDYFEGYTEEEITAQYKLDDGWDRPTWSVTESLTTEERMRRMAAMFYGGQTDPQPKKKSRKKPRKRVSSKIEKALDTLGLEDMSDFVVVKARYRSLALEWHPDKNKGNKKAEDKFKAINEAYTLLKEKHAQE